MMPLLIKFPSRSRPALFESTLKLWNAQPDMVRFVISLDEDDPTLPVYQLILRDMSNAKVFVGTSANKVEAVNRDMEHAGDWQCAVVASDDMLPQCPDYAAIILRLMALHYPDGDGVLHINDGRAGRKLNTLCCAGRRYYDRFGYWYRPLSMNGYASLWCDNEWQDVSEQLGRATYVDDVLVAHRWTDVTGRDDLHQRNEQPYESDAKAYEARRLAGFP